MSLTAWAELLAGGLITGGIYALVAIGLNLQYGLMRIMNISHGEFLMLGAFLTWWAHTALRASRRWCSCRSPSCCCSLLGMAVHRLCFRQLAARAPNVEVFEARSLLVGFGLMFLVQNAALLIWGADLRGYEYLAEPVRARRHALHRQQAGAVRLRAGAEPGAASRCCASRCSARRCAR